MCGRYGLIPGKDFYNRFEIENRDVIIEENNNASPGMFLPVITANSPKKVEMMKWGLIPFWAKDPKIGNRMFNARVEGIETKPAFRKAFRMQRCLIPACGFWEWKDKKPYWFSMKDQQIFSMAGIFDIWTDVEGVKIKSFSILTKPANEIVSPIHDRMPVILDKKNEDQWLDNKIFDIEVLKRLWSEPTILYHSPTVLFVHGSWSSIGGRKRT